MWGNLHISVHRCRVIKIVVCEIYASLVSMAVRVYPGGWIE